LQNRRKPRVLTEKLRERKMGRTRRPRKGTKRHKKSRKEEPGLNAMLKEAEGA
jgi:hypothetical protein